MSDSKDNRQKKVIRAVWAGGCDAGESESGPRCRTHRTPIGKLSGRQKGPAKKRRKCPTLVPLRPVRTRPARIFCPLCPPFLSLSPCPLTPPSYRFYRISLARAKYPARVAQKRAAPNAPFPAGPANADLARALARAARAACARRRPLIVLVHVWCV